MYTEELRMPTKGMVGIAIGFLAPVLILLVLQVILPLPLIGRIAIGAAMLIEIVVCVVLLRVLSRFVITIDSDPLRIGRARYRLHRIVTCCPTRWAGWGTTYRAMGMRHHPYPGEQNAVWLTLTDKAQVLFTTHHPDAVCDALQAHRPQIERREP